MAIFNSYVKLPEGIKNPEVFSKKRSTACRPTDCWDPPQRGRRCSCRPPDPPRRKRSIRCCPSCKRWWRPRGAPCKGAKSLGFNILRIYPANMVYTQPKLRKIYIYICVYMYILGFFHQLMLANLESIECK